MRISYPLLERHSIQSVTDQTDYIKMAAIACNCMSAVTPEQAAIWSYPMRDADAEAVIFNMVNAMLLRIHQSGHLPELTEAGRALVKEGIDVHMQIVDKLKNGLPFWPIGLAKFGDEFMSVGICCGDKKYLAVWRTCGESRNAVRLPIKGISCAKMIYPTGTDPTYRIESGELVVDMAPITARLFELS